MEETFKNVLLISSKKYGKGMRRVKQNKMLLNKIHRTKKKGLLRHKWPASTSKGVQHH